MEKNLETVIVLLRDSLEKNERAKRQDIDALFRNRCQNRRKEGLCKLSAKGKKLKGYDGYTKVT